MNEPKGLFRLILVVVVLLSVNADDMVPMKWICHSTVCEEDIHFCNEQSKRCEACEDYDGQCFSNLQQRNCTKYCMESRQRQIREQGCKVPTLRNGNQTGSQTQVKYKQSIEVECADGYTIVGGKVITCEEYGKWSALPICKGESGGRETSCTLPWVLVAILGIVILVVIVCFVLVTCQRKIKDTCKSRSIENTKKNGDTNGFVQNGYSRQEAEAFLPERRTHDQIAASANVKRLEEVSAPDVYKCKDSDVSSTSSGKSARHVSYDPSTTGLNNIKAAFRQQEPDIVASRRDTGVITPGNAQSAVKQQEGQVVVYNDVNVTQNVFGHKTEHCESCPSPPNPPNTQNSNPDTTIGIPTQETDQTKSPSVRCILPVQPRSDDTERSMEQASMPRQETTDHVTPKTYAVPQATVLPQAKVQTKL